MDNYDTLSLAMNSLKDRGYTEDFNLKQNCIECRDGEYKLFHNDFEIDEIHRFEGETNPSDSSILYAVSSPKYQLKGVLVNGYGIYTEPLTDEMTRKLH